MADNAQKTPFANTMQRWQNAQAEIGASLQGRFWPCSVAKVADNIVTVNIEVQSTVFTFPPVECPVAESEWVRLPIQVGDKGYLVPGDVYLGGMSGLGGGTADLALRGNLTCSVFVPLSNSEWQMDDAGAVLINGPNGVILRDKGRAVVVTISPNGIVINTSGNPIDLNTGGGNVTVTGSGDIIAGSVSLLHHTHIDGGGEGNSGPPAGG